MHSCHLFGSNTIQGTIAFDSNGSRIDNNKVVLNQYRIKSKLDFKPTKSLTHAQF